MFHFVGDKPPRVHES